MTKRGRGEGNSAARTCLGMVPSFPQLPSRSPALPHLFLGVHIPLPTWDTAMRASPESRQFSRGVLEHPCSSLPHAAGDSGREKYPLTSRLCSPGLTRWIISRNPSFPWLLLQFSFCSFSSPFFLSSPFIFFYEQKTFLATIIATAGSRNGNPSFIWRGWIITKLRPKSHDLEN